MLIALLFACHVPGLAIDDGDSGQQDTDTSPIDTDTDPIEGFDLSLDSDVVTMIRASWEDPGSTEAWVEYRIDGGDWLSAPSTGPGEAVILGVPASTEVTARAALVLGGTERRTEDLSITTGTLPSSLLVPDVRVYEPSLALDADWAMIVVAGGSYTFGPPYWIEIFDRQGQIVWYKRVPDSMLTFYPSVSMDGTHIWHESEDIFGVGHAKPSVTRQTLDGRWSVQQSVPNLGQAIAEGPDGSFYFETRSGSSYQLSRLHPDGTVSTEWDCGQWFRAHGLDHRYCPMNTCNWDPVRDTVLVSQFYTDTVFEIDLATGQPIRQMGQLQQGDPWSFDPPESMFVYQHDPYWTSAGTLLVSTHVQGQSGVQVAAEYEVDDATKTLHRIWSYQSSDLWATQLGEARRLPNGNTILGYGQDGAVREVTSAGEVAWEASWPRDSQGYRVIGHLSLIQDLYALNQGPE